MPRKRAKQRAAVEREAARAKAKRNQHTANTQGVAEGRNTSIRAQDRHEGSTYSPSESDDSSRLSDDTASVPESVLEYQRAMMDVTDSEEENESVDSCDVKVIRRFFRKTWRYQDAYRLGLSGKAAEYAVRKYSSHRRVPASALMDVNIIS